MELECIPGMVFLENVANFLRTLQMPSIQSEINKFYIYAKVRALIGRVGA